MDNHLLHPEKEKEKEDIYYIQLCCIYLDEKSTIEKIKREKYFLKQMNMIPVEELKSILKLKRPTKKVYYPFCLLKYNITQTESESESESDPLLVSLRRIETIHFAKSPAIFHELNELIIIFHKYETIREVHVNAAKTRKITPISNPHPHPNQNPHQNTNQNTNHKKTIRIRK
jgi:hypothetical protein